MAVRASVRFPFVFKPLKLDGRLLFNGGMYNNFPYDVAMEESDPEFIIGSKVSYNYPSPDPDDILSQLQKMLMPDTDFDLSVEKGIIIEPQVLKPGLIDFSQTKTLIDSGYVATIRQLPQIKKMISQIKEQQDVQKARASFNHRKSIIELIA